MVNNNRLPVILAGIGASIGALAVLMAWYGFPKIINMRIKEAISMDKTSESYGYWKVTPFPIKMKVYLFHIVNPDEVMLGENPTFKEIGPYVYDEYYFRQKIEIRESTDTIKSVLQKRYYFNAKDSGCYDENDVVTILNPALNGLVMSVNSLVPSALPQVAEAAPYLFPGLKNIFLTVKVRDLLFDGVFINCSAEITEFVCEAIDGSGAQTMRRHKNKRDFLFSFANHLNTTLEGPYVIGRGMVNTSRGEIYERKGKPNFDMWETDYCNMINGTDGTMFQPMEKPKDVIYVWIEDLCRSLYLEYDSEIKSLGIRAFKYTMPEKELADDDERECFCSRGKDSDGKPIPNCYPKGTLDLEKCMMSPTIFTHPHFYLSDDSLLEYVSGLTPIKELHENFIEIEPMTGTPIRGSKRAQFNMPIKKLKGYPLSENLTEGLMPIMWLDQYAELPPNFAQKLIEAYDQIALVGKVKWGMAFVSITLMLSSAIILMKREKFLCFADKSKITDITIVSSGKELDDTLSISDGMVYNNVKHSNLYPRGNNRNVSIGSKVFEERFVL